MVQKEQYTTSSIWWILNYCRCLAACSLQGDFRHKSSFVIWRGRWGTLCWVKDVTCGTALHAVWPRSCHSSCSELSAWLKSNYSSLPKVTGFHRTTMCSNVTHVGTEIGLSSFITTNWILLLNYGVVTLQLLHGFKHRWRWRKWDISLFCR